MFVISYIFGFSCSESEVKWHPAIFSLFHPPPPQKNKNKIILSNYKVYQFFHLYFLRLSLIHLENQCHHHLIIIASSYTCIASSFTLLLLSASWSLALISSNDVVLLLFGGVAGRFDVSGFLFSSRIHSKAIPPGVLTSTKVSKGGWTTRKRNRFKDAVQ